MKKLISILITAVLLMAVFVPAMSVGASGGNYLTIYVEGYGHGLYADNNNPTAENQIFPTENILEPLLAIFEDLTKDLIAGLVTGNYKEYCDRIYNAIAPAYADVKLDKNGEATDGSGWGGDMLTNGYVIDYST